MAKVKVRIAVAVDEDGNWSAYGGSGASDQRAALTAMSELADDPRHRARESLAKGAWIEAEVDVPERLPAPVVNGTVIAA